MQYISDKVSFKPLLPEIVFGIVLIGISALFKIGKMVKVCREEHVKTCYAGWSAVCAAMLFFLYYFFTYSQTGLMWSGILGDVAGYLVLFAVSVPFGRWISE